MAAAYVKCPYCEQKFDRNNLKIKVKQVSAKRYAHYECWQKYFDSLTKEEKDKIDFFNYTKTLFRENYNFILTQKLAEKYIKENNYSYSGMLKTLKWFYEKEGHSTEEANGTIGIIPYVYTEASQYYYKLFLAATANKTKNLVKETVKIVTIESPEKRQKIKLWLEGDEDK